jgi:hypothetical protein
MPPLPTVSFPMNIAWCSSVNLILSQFLQVIYPENSTGFLETGLLPVPSVMIDEYPKRQVCVLTLLFCFARRQ